MWFPPSGTLGELSIRAEARASALGDISAYLHRAISAWPIVPSLRTALDRGRVGVIAEVKRASPSKGVINGTLAAGQRAAFYESGGAAAISVLTEPERFGGSNADLVEVAAACRIPVLRKDFHVAEIQLVEARSLGASAALLIVRALSPVRLAAMISTAREIGLETVVEIRTEAELSAALDAGATIIGVNNRNLETLEVDPATVARILPLIPSDCIAIAESGYSDSGGIAVAAAAGADAVLIGSVLSVADDPAAAVRDLCGVPRLPQRTSPRRNRARE